MVMTFLYESDLTNNLEWTAFPVDLIKDFFKKIGTQKYNKR